ncbi:MAG: hypothetical protein LUG52_04380, partial [Clostridia bacterium]|nr:hypothetical protein [Clostridia bacterium]
IIGFVPIIVGLYRMLFNLCDVNNFMMIIPIFNMYIVMKEILLGCYNYVHIIIVIITYIVLSTVFLKLGVSRINSEKILSIDK